jgi:hypothetical protein
LVEVFEVERDRALQLALGEARVADVAELHLDLAAPFAHRAARAEEQEQHDDARLIAVSSTKRSP